MSSSFSASPAELNLVAQIFAQTDQQKLGILKGEDAVRIFGGAKVAPSTLGEIWSISDEDNNGWLSRKGTAIALRLIGWAQSGEKVSKDLINKPGPIAVVEGFSAIPAQHTGMSNMSIPKSPPPVTGFPPITQADKTKFQNMFIKAGPVNGFLSGDQARELFVKSKLSNDTLLQIWNLADTQDRGALDATDFAIGMYLIQGVMTKTIIHVPDSLPPGIYQQLQIAAPLMQNHTGSRSPSQGSFPQSRPIQPQYTGQAASILQPQGTGMALQPQSTGMLQPHNTGSQKRVPPSLPARPTPSKIGGSAFGSPSTSWDVTAQEKANSDRYFETLDPSKQGFIEGDIAVPFMLESKLPDDTLAHIWDLSDLHNNGRLTKDCFAVAMHLIQKKLAGGDLPEAIPESLIPPSMPQPASTRTYERPFLFHDTPPASATTNEPFNIPMQATGSRHIPSTVSSPQPPSASRDPFGGPARDFLSDDDGAPAVHDRSAEIGNTQNQLNSTNRSLETVKTERASVDDALANQAVQLSSLQTQLSVAKAAYETETKALATLKERHANQTAEIAKARSELISAESELSAVRVEKAEIEGAFLRDKEEARELQRKMIETGKETEALKAETEKAKKDAKQQKGLLAIAKKQLSSKEAERAKAAKELEEAGQEVAAITKEKEGVEAAIEEINSSPPVAIAAPQASTTDNLPPPERATSSDSLTFAAAQPLPMTPDLTASPAASIKSNNPFERLAMSGSPRAQSPFMPFANSSIATPPIGTSKPVEDSAEGTTANAASSEDDPFGLSQLNDTPSSAAPETPKGAPVPLILKESETFSSPTSPTENFSTPPTTATFPPVDTPTRQSSTDASAYDGIMSSPSSVAEGKKRAVDPPETDLQLSLKELNVNESDSSDEEDEVPLAAIQKRLSTDLDGVTKSPSQPAARPTSSFDDVFGDATSPVPSVTQESKTDAFGAPIQQNGNVPDLFGSSDSQQPPTSSHVLSPTEVGVNAFDEAMGKISPTTSSAAPQFSSFDSAFDDNFDFSAAGGSTFPPAPTNNGVSSNGVLTPTAATSPVPNGSEAKPAAPSTVASPAAPQTGSPSFDEVFSGFGSSPALALDGASSSPTTASKSSATESEVLKKQFPSTAAATSSPRSSSGQSSISPPTRQKSPPPRTASPKPTQRPSTASSTKEKDHDKHEKKEAPTRTSKLSIRLPFGRKKKDKDAPPPVPPPAALLTPPREEGSQEDEDVEAVKQLTAMGFSRSQAVDALERYGYDIPRALNSLLGQG